MKYSEITRSVEASQNYAKVPEKVLHLSGISSWRYTCAIEYLPAWVTPMMKKLKICTFMLVVSTTEM